MAVEIDGLNGGCFYCWFDFDKNNVYEVSDEYQKSNVATRQILQISGYSKK